MSEIKDPDGFLTALITESLALARFDELSWIEYKKQWHTLGQGQRDSKEHNEFLKDVTALANTGHEAFLVFGIDEKATPPSLSAAAFTTCGLADSAAIQQKLWTRTDPPLSVEVKNLAVHGTTISYIHIRPTHNRPHLVRNWKHFDKWTGAVKQVYDNALFFRDGAKVLGPQETPPIYPDRQRLAIMFQDRPGRYAEIRIRPWLDDLRIESGRSPQQPNHSMPRTHVVVPAAFANVGAAATTIESMTVALSACLPGAGQPLLVDLPPFTVEYFYNKAGGKDQMPLHVPAREIQAVRLSLYLDPREGPQIHDLQANHPQARVTACIRTTDMLSLEGLERIEFSIPRP